MLFLTKPFFSYKKFSSFYQSYYQPYICNLSAMQLIQMEKSAKILVFKLLVQARLLSSKIAVPFRPIGTSFCTSFFFLYLYRASFFSGLLKIIIFCFFKVLIKKFLLFFLKKLAFD